MLYLLEYIRRWKALDWKRKVFFLRTISWCVFGNGEFTFYCHFCAGISSSRSSTVSFEGSPLSAGGTEGSLISIQYYPNLSSTAPNGPGSESPKYVKIILASNIPLEIAFVCLLHLHVQENNGLLFFSSFLFYLRNVLVRQSKINYSTPCSMVEQVSGSDSQEKLKRWAR